MQRRSSTNAGTGDSPTSSPLIVGTQSVRIDPSLGHLGITLGHLRRGEGVRVEGCHAADIVAKAGIEAGDIIVAIDEQSVWDHGDAMKLMLAHKKPFTVTYRR